MENLKVLVVDDDPMTCNLLETILQMEAYQTVSANHVNAGGIIPLLDKEKPDVIILDFHLGSQETLEFTMDIRASEAWKKLPVLMTSAIDRSQACLQAGADEFILKPFNWQEITQRVNNMRDRLILPGGII
jgi:DNA-binding response OmpR family regulator